jgi:hypothetical protein
MATFAMKEGEKMDSGEGVVVLLLVGVMETDHETTCVAEVL